MSQDIYIINSFPGAVGQVLAGLFNKQYLEAGRPSYRGDVVYDEPEPEIKTAEWFYDHWSVNTANTSSHIVEIPYLPNFENVRSKYPTAKHVVITYTLEDTISIAAAVYQNYFVYAWDSGLYTELFRNIIGSAPHLFSRTDLLPSELTTAERRAVLTIIQNQAFLAGFHNIQFPNDPLVFEIKYEEMTYKPAIFRQKLANIFGEPVQPAVIADYKGFLQKYYNFVYNRYKYHYEST